MSNKPCNLAADELILGSRDTGVTYNGKPAQLCNGFTVPLEAGGCLQTNTSDRFSCTRAGVLNCELIWNKDNPS